MPWTHSNTKDTPSRWWGRNHWQSKGGTSTAGSPFSSSRSIRGSCSRYLGCGSSSTASASLSRSSINDKSNAVGAWISPGAKSLPLKNLDTKALPGAGRRGPRQLFFNKASALLPPVPSRLNFCLTLSDTALVVSNPGTNGARTTAMSLPSPCEHESLLKARCCVRTGGRPHVPNLFTGGPLRGPPPPNAWNFFIVYCELSWLPRGWRGSVSWRGVAWQRSR